MFQAMRFQTFDIEVALTTLGFQMTFSRAKGDHVQPLAHLHINAPLFTPDHQRVILYESMIIAQMFFLVRGMCSGFLCPFDNLCPAPPSP